MNDEAGGRAGERRRGRSESGVFGLPPGKRKEWGWDVLAALGGGAVPLLLLLGTGGG